MFKAILPSSKRISSSDFTMITNPGDPLSGKENLPDNNAVTTVTKSGKGTHKGNSKQEKLKTVKVSQDLVVEPVVMNKAFDKLLVGLYSDDINRWYLTARAHRTSYKFLPLFG
jgi:hypothetical protein